MHFEYSAQTVDRLQAAYGSIEAESVHAVLEHLRQQCSDKPGYWYVFIQHRTMMAVAEKPTLETP